MLPGRRVCPYLGHPDKGGLSVLCIKCSNHVLHMPRLADLVNFLKVVEHIVGAR